MAYAFSRFRFTGRRYGLMFLLLVQMFPAQMSFIAFYYLLLQIHLLDTLVGLILVFIGSGLPFNAWLFKGYIDSLPRDLEEAAYVDGASKLQAYLRVILPLTRPMMAVIFIFVWFGLYSEYLVSSWLLTTQSNFTVPLGLYQFLNNGFLSNWTEFAAGAVLGTIPLMIIFLAMQRFLVAGLARGAVKG
jgi:arabinogalactan oligomer/maltooligosaccharide transport system permease protein